MVILLLYGSSLLVPMWHMGTSGKINSKFTAMMALEKV
jgi:hypothetical protein